MTSHTEKSTRAPLIHHPSDALDCFGRYDSSSRVWREFNIQISERIANFEASHPQYLRRSLQVSRRSSWSNQPR